MSTADCLFCKIITGDIPSEKVLDTETVLAFKDINPVAPTHLLIIPKQHVASVSDTEDPQIFADVIAAAKNIAEQGNLKDFRLVNNNGAGAGQTVFHLHFHLIAGRKLTWPPG